MIGQLPRRQCEIILLLAKGYTNDEIARELDISIQTVKNHLYKLFRKFQCDNRTELAVLWLRSKHSRRLREMQGQIDELESQLAHIRRLTLAEASQLVEVEYP